jgi:hypothetical protein
MINLKDIINDCNKYHYIIINKQTNGYKYKSYPKKKTHISIKNKEKLVLIKLKTISKKMYSKEKNSPIKVSGGPLYAEINVYSLFDGKIIKEKKKFKNKVYFPKKYIKKIYKENFCKYIKKNILEICYSYINNKLNQGLISINTIYNI